MKSHYEEATMANKREIENLTKSLDEAQNLSQTITNNIRVLLQTNHEQSTAQLKAALDKGWTTWATQVAELHKLNEKKAEASTSSMRKALRNTRGPCAGLSYASGPPLRGTHAAVGRFRGKSRRHFSLANGDQK